MSRTRSRSASPPAVTPARPGDALIRAARTAVEALEGRTLLATTVVAVADADVWNIPGNTEVTAANFGADPFLRVNGDSDNRSDSYLKFDLGAVDSIGSASLILRGARSGDPDDEISVGVFPILATDWVEGNGTHAALDTDDSPGGEVRWANRPTGGGGMLGEQDVGAFGDYVWNVTAHLQREKAAGRDLVTFVLRGTGGGDGEVTFASRENASGPAPTLSIEPDTTAPAAAVSAPDVSGAGSSTIVTVTYTDNAGIDVGSIGVSDLNVTRATGGPLNVVSFSVDSSGGPGRVVASYVVEAPGGAWDASDNGAYTVTLKDGEVTDLAGFSATGPADTFNVAVGGAVDAEAPVAQITAADITTPGGSTQTITVVYTDNVAVRGDTIGGNDITVTRPGGGTLTILNVDAQPAGDGASLTVTYTVSAPGPLWGPEDSGTYTITVRPNNVRDTSNNGVIETVGTFEVALGGGGGGGPAASVSVSNVTTSGTSHAVTVVYTDDSGIDVATIETDDIIVARSGGGPAPFVSGVSVSPAGNGTPRTATYTIVPPGGSWDFADNGTYTVTVLAGEVADVSGNTIVDANASFNVNVPESTAPTVVISPLPNITSAGGTSTLIAVTYADDTAINASTVDGNDVAVVRAGSGEAPLIVTLVSASTSSDGRTVTATYSAAAPGGFWTAAANGTYTVSVGGGQVRDSAGNGNAGAAASFQVSIFASTVVLDPTFNGGDPVSNGFVAEGIASDVFGGVLIVGRQGDRAAGSSQSVVQRLHADGSLDTFFGQGGQFISADQQNEGFHALAVDGAGRIYAAGFHGGDLLLARYTARGVPDRKFGRGGVVVTDLGGAADTAYAVALAPDGRIVVAGGTGTGDYALARYFDNGSLDTSFGSGGIRTLRPGSAGGMLGGVVVLGDGGVVAAGSSDGNVAVVRLDASGAPVATFGTNGVIVSDRLASRSDLGQLDRTQGVALDREGRVLVAARSAGAGQNFAVARLDPNGNGSFDATFGNAGVATTDFGGDDDADCIAVQATGQIIVTGTTDAGGVARIAVAAFTSLGTLDGSFASGGKFTADAGVVVGGSGRSLHIGTMIITSVAGLGRDGRLVIAAGDQTPAPTTSSLRRLIVPGSGKVGEFGSVNGRTRKLTFFDQDGTRVTLSLKGGGSGEALYDGNALDLILSGTGPRSTLSIAGRGGDRRVALRDLRTDGALRAFSGKTTDLSGSLSVRGGVAKATLGKITGTFASGGSVASLTVAGDVTGATVLSGADLGSDGHLGGTGDAADAFGAGSFGKLAVKGVAGASTFGAGLDPVNGAFLDGNDTVVGGSASLIVSIKVKGGTEESTRFVAGGFSRARLPEAADPLNDPRFLIL